MLISFADAILHQTLGEAETAALLVERVVTDVADFCGIWLYSRDGSRLDAVSVRHRDSGEKLPKVISELAEQAARRQHMIVIDDIAAEPPPVAAPPAALPQHGRVQAICVAPLAAHSDIRGVLVVGCDRPTAGFDGDDQALVAELADWAAIALANLRLVGDVRAELAARQHAEADLRATEERFRRLFANSPVGSALVAIEGNRLGHFQLVNDAYCRLTGYSRKQLLTMTKAEVTHPDDVAGDDDAIFQLVSGERDVYQREKRYTHVDGGMVWARVNVTLTVDRGVPTAIVHAEDITAQKTAEAELARWACSDPLTGLANRAVMLDRLHLALDQLERHHGYVAVLYIDLDRFKPINDSHGHGHGDEVLRTVAGRLQQAICSIDTVARVGGDEFVVVCPSVHDEEDAIRVARRIMRTVGDRISLNGEQTFVTASIGIVLADGSNHLAANLVHAADIAMHRAKERGRNRFELYDRDLADLAERRLQIEHDLRVALLRHRQYLHYQPIIDLGSGRTVGVEALLRVEHPTRGILDAAEFIDVAEDIGAIVDLGEWILHEACRQLAAWHHQTGTDLELSVNVSGRQAAQANLTDLVIAATTAAGIQPHQLAIELTETVLLDAGYSIVNDLANLTQKGVHLSLDDFGTGYSSLTYLKRFPVDNVKIDRSFVVDITDNADDRAIVQGIVSLCRSLGITATAEGVETPAQLALLREFGCHRAQGFHLGRPQPAEQLTGLFAST